MVERKFYWLKLQHNFFEQPRVKKLRRMAGGDTYTLIYLKILLISLESGGVLEYEGIEDNFEEELALRLDEDPENIRFLMLYLYKHGLIEEIDNRNYIMVEAVENTGSETSSAVRKRRSRERLKAGQCHTDVTPLSHAVTNIPLEKEKDIDIDKDNKNTTSSKLDDEFESLWSCYPKKQGKEQAKKAYKKAVKEKAADYQTVLDGINRYLQYISSAGVESKYIKQGSTWFNQRCWNDEYDTTPPGKGRGHKFQQEDRDLSFLEL